MSDEAMQSESVAALFAALSKVQAVIRGAKKDAVNPHLKNKYADLASVWDACREALVANGFCVVQTGRQSGPAGVCVVTTLGHSSGEWIRGEMYMPAQKPDAQGFGSALTYARRYGLAAIVGVSPEDDDANEASLPGPQRGPIKAPAATAQQQATSLPTQLADSVTMLDRAVALNAELAAARNMGEIHEVWNKVNALVRDGLPRKSVEALQALKERRKAEFVNGSAA
jgi:hypothetical protein